MRAPPTDERSPGQTAWLCLVWIIGHLAVAAVLSAWPDLVRTSRSGLPAAPGLWATVVLVVQVPLLVYLSRAWTDWPRWLAASALLAAFDVFLYLPFANGFTFALCRGSTLASVPCQRAYLLSALVPMSILVGIVQWRLGRRHLHRTGWLVPAQAIGMVAFAFAFVETVYSSGPIVAGLMLRTSPNLMAGLMYALVVALALPGFRLRRHRPTEG